MTHNVIMNNPFQSNLPTQPFCPKFRIEIDSCTNQGTPQVFHVLVHSLYYHLAHFRLQFLPHIGLYELLFGQKRPKLGSDRIRKSERVAGLVNKTVDLALRSYA